MMEKLQACAVRPRGRPSTERRPPIGLMLAGLLLCAVAEAQMFLPELGHGLTRLDPPVVAADFTLVDMDDAQHGLGDYRGKVIMLNFWGTWCPPCRREMPSMEALYQEFRDESFIVLAVNQWEDGDLVFPFIGQLSVFPTFPILFDREGAVAEAYGVKGLPTTVLINRQGEVVYRAVGGRDFAHPEVRRLIRELLE